MKHDATQNTTGNGNNVIQQHAGASYAKVYLGSATSIAELKQEIRTKIRRLTKLNRVAKGERAACEQPFASGPPLRRPRRGEHSRDTDNHNVFWWKHKTRRGENPCPD